MKRRQPPSKGDRVEFCQVGQKEFTRGVVDWIGAAQFAVDYNEKNRILILTNGDGCEWRYVS